MNMKETEVMKGFGWDVRHLVLEGSHRDIGYMLGQIGRDRHGVRRAPTDNQLLTKSRRRYYESNYPIHAERMRGFASAYHLDPEDDRYDLSVLGHPLSGLNCSAVYYSPAVVDNGHGLISKNLDFIANGPLGKPYIIELRPKEGYASLAIMSFEVMGQRLEGINSEGLTVVHLADDETPGLGLLDPAGEDGVGISELQAAELLLDTCATVEEAKETLLTNKHYYHTLPVHLLVADRTGRAFVWEFASIRNREYIIDLANKPQVMTNFLLHRHTECEALPFVTAERCCMFNRYRALEDGLRSFDAPCNLQQVYTVLDRGVMDKTAFVEENPVRTVWQELWDMEERSLEIRFNLGDDLEQQGRCGAAFSQRYKFSLE